MERDIGVDRFGRDTSALIGVGLFLLGCALGISSGLVMSTLGRGTPLPTACPALLVIRGPYAYIRNPMVLAGLTQGVGVGLIWGSVGVLLYVFLGGVFWQRCVRPPEEADLLDRFGPAYERYRREVRCWLPRIDSYRT